MNPADFPAIKLAQRANRRTFMSGAGLGLGAVALGALGGSAAARGASGRVAGAGLTDLPHFPARAKRVIYLFQSGAPAQMELWDHKPQLTKFHQQELPESIRQGQRLTTMTSGQSSFPVAKSKFSFSQHGASGTWVSDLLPHTGGVVDNLCVVRSMHTEAINHDPAITFCQTGSQIAGRPSMGAWIAYGLGTANRNLPTFTVMVSFTRRSQPLYDRLWGSGFLPTKYQGVKLRSGAEPVLYLSNPAGCSVAARRAMLDDIAALNSIKHSEVGDPEILTRIEQYELAYRMQTTVPELADISGEPQHVLELYGPDVHRPGSFARNCLLARRLAERDVRFVQLYHMGWDQHLNLPVDLPKMARDTDQASAALITDLKQRGMLDDTLVVWGGEFGRTVYCQGPLTTETYGRDHHPRCFSIWMAGGGVRPGVVYGRTDDFSYNIVEDPVEIFDLNATIMHLLGIDHTRLTYKFQGRDYRLTDVHGRIVHDLLA